MPRLFTAWQAKWYPRSVLFAVFIGFVIAGLSGSGASTLTGRFGGDYPAFYSSGRIVAQGEGNHLYDPALQSRVQTDLFLENESGYLPFAYPPFVALAYFPLSFLNYRISYALHTLLMIGALALAIRLSRPILTQIEQHFLAVLALALTFFPMFRAVFGAQNTAVTLLLIVSAWRLVLNGREWLAGMILGLLLFKPQFAIPLIGLHVLSGRWRVGFGSLFSAAVLYIISAWISGPLWIVSWFKFAWQAAQTDAGVNYANSVSWIGFFEAVSGAGNPIALMIGWGMTILTAAGISFFWRVGGRRADPTVQFAAAVPALALMPPHVMFYDLGLLLFTYAVLFAKNRGRAGLLIGFAWLFALSQAISALVGFSPLFFLLLYTAVLTLHTFGRGLTRTAESAGIRPVISTD